MLARSLLESQESASLGLIPELAEFPFPTRPAALMATPLAEGSRERDSGVAGRASGDRALS